MPALELFDGLVAIVGEAIEVARVIALRLWCELTELLASLVVGDHGGDASLSQLPRRGAKASKQRRVASIKLGTVWIPWQTLVNASLPEVVPYSTGRIGLHLHISRQGCARHGSLSPA